MSERAKDWAFAQNHVRHPARAVLVTLGFLADDNGQCHPSGKELAALTGLSERTVRSCVKALRESGLIGTTRRLTEDGGTASLLYQVPARQAEGEGDRT